MKKKLFGTLLTAVLVVATTVSAFAAPSKTAQVTLVGDSVGKYETAEITQDSFQDLAQSKPEVVNKILAVNAGTESLESIGEQAPDIAPQLEGKSLLTKFFDLTPVNGGVKNADGKYVVTLSVPALSDAASDVLVLHYSTERNLWEVITPSNVDVANKEITAEFEDLSPVAIIAKVDASAATDNAVGSAPKTGVASDWAMYLGAAVVLLGAAGIVAKKSRA